ncbi:interferon alpha-inducible protein 27-like protein 1 [Alosa pseudoharengus]|uniref:interferon alpha-inducible protein 27-like protein 1 n=1 Tax=Alosa pseudoharengus TaxID=34774 RepID=UPI003F8A0175
MIGVGVVIKATIGALGALVMVPAALSAIGFGSAGIAAGSTAAGMMSGAAVTNGGGVAAGSLVAALQSAGAAGLSLGAKAAVAVVGGAVGSAWTVLSSWRGP